MKRTGSPSDWAWVGSKQNSKKVRLNISTTIETKARMIKVYQASLSEMPSTSPNRTWVRSTELIIFEISISPSAKRVVKTIPITASSLILVLFLMYPMRTTASMANTKAPSPKGIPSMYASTTPGSTACEMASPRSDQPLSTKKQDRIAQATPTTVETTTALNIKAYCNGSKIKLRISI